MLVRALAVLTVCALMTGAAAAQSYPSRPIKLLVGAPPGGTTDLIARGLGQELTKSLGQQIVVENRGGAGGNIAAEAVARSEPDGYTLLMCFTSHSINASLFPSLPFDPVKDFTPISLVATQPSLLVAHPSVPAQSFAELIAFARRQPGRLNIAIGGAGSSVHMAGDMLKMLSGVEITNIIYRGTAPAMNDVVAGQVELMFASVLTGAPQIKAGKVKLLAVSSAERLAAFPDTPAIAEVLPGYESNGWFGLLGPARLPPEVVRILSEAAMKGARSPEFGQRITGDGGRAIGSTPDEFRQFLAADIARYAAVVKATGAKPE